MISRFVVFGCSYAEGQFLSGWKSSYENHSTVYSPHSYASLLGNHFNVPVANMARGGNSNHEILLDILKYDFRPGDYALVSWSFPQRSIVFTSQIDRQLYRTRDLLDSWLGDNFYKAHDQYDLEIRTLEHISHAKLYFKFKNINNNMNWIYPIENVKNFNVPILDTSKFLLFRVIDFALDNSHPGIQSHKEFFNQLKQLIENE